MKLDLGVPHTLPGHSTLIALIGLLSNFLRRTPQEVPDRPGCTLHLPVG